MRYIFIFQLLTQNGRRLLISGLLILNSALGVAQQSASFPNPLLPNGADPWVIQKDGYYYYLQTEGNALIIRRTRELAELKNAETKTVWQPPASGPNSKDIWAPELHFLDGKWYLYYTATDVNNPGDHTRAVFVLENEAANPLQGKWMDRGRVNTHHPGLDGSVFEHRGKRYFLYSAYVGPQSVLVIAPMINPWTISDQQVMIAKPTLSWEKYDNREILEGPEFLPGKNGKIFIMYSASACWDDNYSLGMLTASQSADLLQAQSWQKSPQPVFQSSPQNNVYGPGHNCFTKSPDGKHDWIVYHAKSVANGRCEKRNPRVQPFTWNADGSPHFGIPVRVNTSNSQASGK